MTYPVLTLPQSANGAWKWPIHKTPRYATLKQTPVSQRGQLRVSVSPYPIWQFEMSWEFLTGRLADLTSTVNQLVGLYASLGGSAGSFLFQDPYDSAATAAAFGTGDGTTTVFPLQRPIGVAAGVTGWDLVQNLDGTPTIYVNGTATAPASISATGEVTFSAAPANGAALTWTGSFYFLCHFLDDAWDDLAAIQTSDGSTPLWELPTVKFESVLL